jgi:hypothetical protein
LKNECGIVCAICGEKLHEEEGQWAHWKCFYALRDYIRKTYGKSISKKCWSMFERENYIKEYLRKNKEVVQFT